MLGARVGFQVGQHAAFEKLKKKKKGKEQKKRKRGGTHAQQQLPELRRMALPVSQ
jgi:hypothetical protein